MASQASAVRSAPPDATPKAPVLTGWRHAAAGMTAGAIPCLLLHPLDTLKIRLQVQEQWSGSGRPAYSGMTHAARSILREEGWRAFYQGLAPSLLGNSVSWGSYLFLYHSFKGRLTALEESKRRVALEDAEKKARKLGREQACAAGEGGRGARGGGGGGEGKLHAGGAAGVVRLDSSFGSSEVQGQDEGLSPSAAPPPSPNP